MGLGELGEPSEPLDDTGDCSLIADIHLVPEDCSGFCRDPGADKDV